LTIDEGYISTRELMLRTEAEDRERARAERDERDLLESVEAEESKWRGIFRQSAEREAVHYDLPHPDRWQQEAS